VSPERRAAKYTTDHSPRKVYKGADIDTEIVNMQKMQNNSRCYNNIKSSQTGKIMPNNQIFEMQQAAAYFAEQSNWSNSGI